MQGPAGGTAFWSQSGGCLAVARQAPKMAPVVSAGAFSLGMTNAPAVIRSPGGLAMAQPGKETSSHSAQRVTQENWELAGSFLNRVCSPKKRVLLVPSVTLAILTTLWGMNMPSPPPQLQFE